MIIGFDNITLPESTDNSFRNSFSLAVGDEPIYAAYIGDTLIYENEDITNGAVRMYHDNVTYKDLMKDTTAIKDYIIAFINEGAYKACWAESIKPILVKRNNGDMEFIYDAVPGKSFTIDGIKYNPKGNIRSLSTGSVVNARDIGGKPTIDGHKLKYNRLIRSGHLDYATAQETEYFRKSCNVIAEIDFRAEHESKNNKSVGTYFPYGKNVKYYGPVYDASGNPTYKYTLGAYTLAFQNFENIINACIDAWKNNGCVHVHCVAGADRTGMFCYILEALCGVTTDECVKDFELTSLSAHINGHYIDQESYLRKANKILAAYGSTLQEQAVNYMKKKYKLSDTKINEIRKYLLD